MSELKTTKISVNSRASVKIGDSFFTFEFGLEKAVPDDFDVDKLPEEKRAMWDEANGEIDRQIVEISEYLKSKRVK